MKIKYYLIPLLLGLLVFNTSLIQALSVDLNSSVKIKGDVRLRLQQEQIGDSTYRNRHRLRLRVGSHFKVSDQTNFHLGLASGGDDPRSTNQTYQDSFETTDIRLDYAYIEQTFGKKWTFLGGKIKNPIWRTSDLLWDSDINPEGYSIKYNTNVNKDLTMFITSGLLILDEIEADTHDPYLWALQSGSTFQFNNNTKATAALSAYYTTNLKGVTFEHTAKTNTGHTTGLDDDFNVIALSSNIAFSHVGPFEMVSPFGEVLINTKQTHSNKGGIVGVKFGHQKVKGAKTWQSTISYRILATNAWLDIFPDSDSYGGATNIEGLELVVKYGVTTTSYMAIDLYSMNKLNGPKNNETLVQLDYNLQF